MSRALWRGVLHLFCLHVWSFLAEHKHNLYRNGLRWHYKKRTNTTARPIENGIAESGPSLSSNYEFVVIFYANTKQRNKSTGHWLLVIIYYSFDNGHSGDSSKWKYEKWKQNSVCYNRHRLRSILNQRSVWWWWWEGREWLCVLHYVEN